MRYTSHRMYDLGGEQTAQATLRKSLSQPGLLQAGREEFASIPDPKNSACIPLANHVISSLAVFGLKFPSLLQADRGRDDEIIHHNLGTLYGIKQAPVTLIYEDAWTPLTPLAT